MPNSESVSSLKLELEEAIRTGRCAYCRRPALPESPLTREHVIPRAKGGARKDARIIVPACARCNQRRGCRELVVFLLKRPRRISAFLDYLTTLSPESIRQMDMRVIAELYAAIWMLSESVDQGEQWRTHLRRLCSGRTLHRRRYAARRVVGGAAGRLASQRARGAGVGAPGLPLPQEPAPCAGPLLEEPLEQISSRLLGLLALAWRASMEEVRSEMERAHENSAAPEDGVVSLDGWRQRPRRRRLRVDRRGGRRAGSARRGRAA